jgi:hemolysin III
MHRLGYSRAEIAADAIVHALGVAFALVAGPVLIMFAVRGGEGAVIASVSVYAAAMLAMFAFSAAYNLTPVPRWRAVLRRLDHGAIYLMIAGTYTPIAAISLAGGAGRTLLLAVWTAAAIGFALKVVAPRRLEAASLLLYLALGWAGAFVGGEMLEKMSGAALILIGVGGALYTVGTAFHVWSDLRFQNAIWHLHVLIASVCMYAAIAVEVL